MTLAELIQKTGIRRLSQMGNPKQGDMFTLRLPKRPILHFPASEVIAGQEDSLGGDLGLTPQEQVLFFLTKKVDLDDLTVYVNNVLKGSDVNGGYVGKPKKAEEYNKEYFKRYPQFSRIFNADSVMKNNHAVIYNYGLLERLYPIRTRSRLTDFNRISDSLATTVANIKELSLTTDRTQYVTWSVPEKLPEAAEFKTLLHRPTLNKLRELKGHQQLFLFYLFDWFVGYNESKDYVNPLKALEERELSKLVLLIHEANKFNSIHFETFNQMRLEESSEKKFVYLYTMFERFVELRSGVEVSEGDVESEEFDILAAQLEEVQQRDPTSPLESNYLGGVQNKINEMAESGRLSTREYSYLLKQAEKYKKIPNPFGGEGTLETMLTVDMDSISKLPEGTAPDIPTIIDKSYLKNTITDFDRNYMEERFEKDLVRTVMSVQKAGLIVTDFKVEEKIDAANHILEVKVQIVAPDGQTNTIKFPIPKVDEEGTFVINGVRSRLDPQRADAPIRKTKPGEVALTSSSGKLFITLSDLAVANFDKALKDSIGGIIIQENSAITNVRVGRVFDSYLKLPKTYSTLAMKYRRFTHGGIDFNFDYKKREAELNLTKDELKLESKYEAVVVGRKGKTPVLIDYDNNFFTVTDGKVNSLGDIVDLLDLDREKLPVPFSEIVIGRRRIPVMMLLVYLHGLENLLAKLGLQYQVEDKNSRRKPEVDEVMVRFEDSKMFIKRKDAKTDLLLGGLVAWKSALKEVKHTDLNEKGGLVGPFTKHRIGNSHQRKYELYGDMWVDPIAEILLHKMKEPTEFDLLLIRATELLTTDWSPRSNDSAYMVDKHYSRMIELVHKELMVGVEDYRNNRVRQKAKMSIRPKAVQVAITTDSAITQINDINPMMADKERGRITYGGTHGRSSRTMANEDRQFHESDIGKVSEGGVDSGKVGTVFWTSANPTYDSLYGTMREWDAANDGNASILSPTALCMPFSTNNDLKRVMFGGIQIAHWINSEGLTHMSARTPFDLMMAHRVGKLYAFPARQDGKIIRLTENVIEVKYADGTTDTCQLGKLFGVSTGKTMPHEMICDLKANASFKAGDILAFNKLFFKRDWLNPTQVGVMMGAPARVALKETEDTYEDASSMSKEMAKRNTTIKTKVKDILVNFDDTVSDLVKVGAEVGYNTKLCTIRSAVGTLGDKKSEGLEGLQALGDGVPLAQVDGVIEHIEVLYCGDLSLASDSVGKIIRAENRRRKSLAVDLKKGPTTGEILEPTYIANNYVNKETVLIRVYVSYKAEMRAGDKLVVDGPLKSVPGNVFNGNVTTFRGVPIDMKFSYAGIMNRITLSPEYAGLLNLIMNQIGLNAVTIGYGGELPMAA